MKVVARSIEWNARLLGRLVRIVAGVSVPQRSVSEVVPERLVLLRMLALAGRVRLIVLIAGHVLSALGPASLALATGWLVRKVAAGPDGVENVAAPLSAFALVLVAQHLGQLTSDTAGAVVARRIDQGARRLLRDVALAPPGVAHLESSTFQDDAVRVSDLGHLSGRPRSPGTASIGQVTLVFRILAAVMAASVVAQFSVVLAVVLLLLSLLIRAVIRTQWLWMTEISDRAAPEMRRAGYWADLTGTEAAAKEMRLFGLGPWVTSRMTQTQMGWLEPLWQRKQLFYGRQSWLLALEICSAGPALLVLGLATVNGSLDVDQLAMYMTAMWGVFALSNAGLEAFDIEYGIGAVHALRRLSARDDVARPTNGTVVAATSDPPVIEFAGVQFHYPASRQAVLDGLNLSVQPGEVLAIVGVNGAGKTTMTKLLGGLYEPTSGRITVAGTDLADLDVACWQRRVTILFQDFLRYPLSCGENVALGAADRPIDNDVVRAVMSDAEAVDLLDELPDGLDTPLTRSQTGGVDLSGGQWQRIALARVLYAVQHGRDVVVLDEPTAHLDVQSEAEFFDRVVAAVSGATVVLISHRLSTIRKADRIVLLDGARIIESGTHDELRAGGGEYAKLFRLQASRFDDHADFGAEK